MEDHQASNSQYSTTNSDGYLGRLACQACQRKKIKCSRTFPCEQCSRSGLQCVPSTRKARTRHAGKRAVDSELRNRITKLESLVESLSGDVGGATDQAHPDEAEIPGERRESSTVSKYIGSPFWSSLTMEVQALREALEQEQSEDEPEPPLPAATFTAQGDSVQYDLLLLPPGVVVVTPGALPTPSHETSAKLCEVFISNVNAFLRIVHVPSLRGMMVKDECKPYMGHDSTAPAIKALKASIWFAATTSLKDSECLELLGQPRGEMLAHFRRHVDVALSQADLLNTTDLCTIQALVAYIICLRPIDTGRRVWTMAAVLVRLTRAMGMHHESVSHAPFVRELRRRLWYAVRFIDVWTSIDRGTELLIDPTSSSTPMPNNANDAEFDETAIEIPNHTTGLTDMSLARIAHIAVDYTSRLIVPEDRPGGNTWQHRFQQALEFKKIINEQVLQYCDESNPAQKNIIILSRTIIASMQLRAIRPMQKHVSSVPPPVHSPFVLKIAIENLKAGEAADRDPDVKGHRWMVWVQWHALATTIAGLCFHRDNELANDAWPIVERTYERNARVVADTRNGMLWRPVEKLYKKAVQFRDHGTMQDSSPSNQSEGTPKPLTPNSRSALLPESSLPNPHPTTAAATMQFPGAGSTQSALAAPTTFNTYPHPVSPTSQNHNGLPHGAMPMGGVDIGFDFDDFNDASMMNFAGSDINWMDFERIYEDISNPTVDAALSGDAMNWASPGQGMLSDMDWQG